MRLIDADALLYDFRRTIEDCKKWEKDAKDSWVKTKAEHAQQDFIEAVLRLKAQPTIDAAPVVRCKDCKHYNSNMCCIELGLLYAAPLEYCSRGERSENIGD